MHHETDSKQVPWRKDVRTLEGKRSDAPEIVEREANGTSVSWWDYCVLKAVETIEGRWSDRELFALSYSRQIFSSVGKCKCTLLHFYAIFTTSLPSRFAASFVIFFCPTHLIVSCHKSTDQDLSDATKALCALHFIVYNRSHFWMWLILLKFELGQASTVQMCAVNTWQVAMPQGSIATRVDWRQWSQRRNIQRRREGDWTKPVVFATVPH